MGGGDRGDVQGLQGVREGYVGGAECWLEAMEGLAMAMESWRKG